LVQTALHRHFYLYFFGNGCFFSLLGTKTYKIAHPLFFTSATPERFLKFLFLTGAVHFFFAKSVKKMHFQEFLRMLHEIILMHPKGHCNKTDLFCFSHTNRICRGSVSEIWHSFERTNSVHFSFLQTVFNKEILKIIIVKIELQNHNQIPSEEGKQSSLFIYGLLAERIE
jgi:hypothetical protein